MAALSAKEAPDGTHVFEIVPATKLFSINVPEAFPNINDLNCPQEVLKLISSVPEEAEDPLVEEKYKLVAVVLSVPSPKT